MAMGGIKALVEGLIASELLIEICKAYGERCADTAKSLHIALFDGPIEISAEDQDAAARVIGVVINSLMFEGEAQQLVAHNLPFFRKLAKKAEQRAAEACDCPKHRAEREAKGASGDRPTT